MSADNQEDKGQAELDALSAVVTALRPLSPESQRRVIDSASILLNMGSVQGRTEVDRRVSQAQIGAASAAIIQDIRALKQEKVPKSANEMAAVVAYYLAEVVNPSEQKKTIDIADVEKYFKQAQYPLPNNVQMTLVNAKSAGYFDAEGSGQYKLNPVGYNLVAHTLPRSDSSEKMRPSRRRKPSKKPSRKRAK